MTAFLALIRKDLKLFLSDPRAVLMSLVAPIAIASFFGYIFGGGAGNGDNAKIPILITNQDGSAITREVINNLAADPSLDVKPATPEQGRAAVRKGKATAAFVIPPNFGRTAAAAFLTGVDKPEIGMMFDPSHSVEMRMLEGILHYTLSMMFLIAFQGSSTQMMPTPACLQKVGGNQ